MRRLYTEEIKGPVMNRTMMCDGLDHGIHSLNAQRGKLIGSGGKLPTVKNLGFVEGDFLTSGFHFCSGAESKRIRALLPCYQ